MCVGAVMSWFLPEVMTGTNRSGFIPDLPPKGGPAAASSDNSSQFSGSTTIEFEVAEAGDVQLDVYNVLGRRVVRVVDQAVGIGANLPHLVV